MQELLNQLNDNLYRQAKLYERLCEVAKEKQKALIHNNLSEIERITKLEEQHILEATQLEQERLKWSEQIGKIMGKPAEDLTLSELVERFPQLKEVQIYLDNVIGQLKDIHKTNTQLLEQAIQVVNFTLDLLTKPDETTYGKPGEDPAAVKKFHLVDKSV